MKRALLAAALLIGMTAQAQDNSEPIEYAYFSNPSAYTAIDPVNVEKAYVAALQIENQGVIESALAQVAWMRLMLPEEPLTDLRAEVSRLAASSESPAVRIQAYLAGLVFDHPEMFRNAALAKPKDPAALFGTFAGQLQRMLASQAGENEAR
jgi:hypothetical protein